MRLFHSSGTDGFVPSFSRRAASVCVCFILTLSACSVPEHMRVRSGVDPRNQDDNVRFRTLYYFRVFDACFDIKGKSNNKYYPHHPETHPKGSTAYQPFNVKTEGRYRVLSDTLYRFRMTGKANPLFSAVHFESGTLHASEIDPFGANVEFDPDSRRYRFVSRQETEARARSRAIYKELRKLDKMVAEISSKDEEVRKLNLTGIRARIAALWSELSQLDGGGSSDESDARLRQPPAAAPLKGRITVEELAGFTKRNTPRAPDRDSSDTVAKLKPETEIVNATEAARQEEKKKSIILGCPEQAAKRRGFQILGPEGFRTFNQDERLILAMSISGKPLISALKDIAGRVLNEQPSSAGKSVV